MNLRDLLNLFTPHYTRNTMLEKRRIETLSKTQLQIAIQRCTWRYFYEC